MAIVKNIIVLGNADSGADALISGYVNSGDQQQSTYTRNVTYGEHYYHLNFYRNPQTPIIYDAFILCINAATESGLSEMEASLPTEAQTKPIAIVFTDYDQLSNEKKSRLSNEILAFSYRNSGSIIHYLDSGYSQEDIKTRNIFRDILERLKPALVVFQALDNDSDEDDSDASYSPHAQLPFFTCKTVTGIIAGAGLGASLSTAIAIGVFVLVSGAVMPANLAVGISILCACAVAGLVLGAVSVGGLVKVTEECHNRRNVYVPV